MSQASSRIDGWKAIAAHFGRDRTTVMRWARERNLPIRRVPGGGASSVYALTEDLDRWLAGEPELAVASADTFRIHYGWLLLIALLLTAVAAAGFLDTPAHRVEPAASAQLPADPEVAALYLKARDDWAQRTPESLRRALSELGQVVSRDPGFARGYTGLADAYLLAREYAAVPEGIAYAKAKAAARVALALDPNLADAHRALGFIQYWWEHDNAAAGASFRAASRLAPANAQTHHWYGNILFSNGQFDAALRELDSARLLDPGSVSIRSDVGWALWSAGRRREGRKVLAEIASTQPDYCAAHRYLVMIDLAERDYPGYLHESAERGRTCGDSKLAAQAREEDAAFAHGGVAGLQQVVVVEAQAQITDPHITRDWLALAQSISGDRQGLAATLREADRRHETWTFGMLADQVSADWPGDAEIQNLLARRKPRRVE